MVMFSQVSGIDLIIIFVSIIVSMGIHEAMHAFTSHWLGDVTAKDQGRLTLNPLKHIDIVTTVLLPMVLIILRLQPFFIAKPVPFNPDRVKYEEYGAALIGIAGPFTNFFLAVIAALIMRISGIAVGTDIFNIISIFIQVNLSFFVFNMIPFPPLDGSRLLYAFAPEPLQRVMYRIESGGIMTIIIFMLLLFPIIGPIVGSITNSLYIFLLS
jgi:Zn-dependent protease